MIIKFTAESIETNLNGKSRVYLVTKKLPELTNEDNLSASISIYYPTSKLDFSLGEYEVTFKKIK